MFIYTCVRVRVYSQDPCDGPGCRQGVRLAQRPAAEQEQHLLQHGARRQPRVRPVMADTMTSVITTRKQSAMAFTGTSTRCYITNSEAMTQCRVSGGQRERDHRMLEVGFSWVKDAHNKQRALLWRWPYVLTLQWPTCWTGIFDRLLQTLSLVSRMWPLSWDVDTGLVT